MGLLYCPRFVALGATGAILPGAKLYTFDSVSITTPKATYSDNGLTTSNGAYVQADSSGVFPPIFGAANEQYYMLLKTSGDVTVDEFPFATILGADATATFLKDLGLNGRFLVSGSGGVVQIETGNAEGDDVGGSGRLGGYGGTQGDALEIDYAAITTTGPVAVTGNLSTTADLSATGNLSSTGGLVTLGGIARAVPRCTLRSSATAAATTSIALDSAYECWEIHIRNLLIAGAGGTPAMKMSFDNGGSFKSGSGDYYVGAAEQGSSAFTNTPWASATSVQIGPASSSSSETGSGCDIFIRITSKAARETRADARYLNFDVTTAADRTSGWHVASTNNKNYGKITNIQVFDTLGGNLTFDYVVIGLP